MKKIFIDEPTQLKQLKLNEISKPLWIEVSRKDFNSLMKDVADNLDNINYKTSGDGNDYDFKNCRKSFAGNSHQKN